MREGNGHTSAIDETTQHKLVLYGFLQLYEVIKVCAFMCRETAALAGIV